MTDDPHSPARLDWRNRVVGRFLRMSNPLARRFIGAGIPTGAPNILLTVRGRRSGTPRTIPVGLLEFDSRTFVQSSYGETGWVMNLRAAGEATVTHSGGRRVPVRAVELPPDEEATAPTPAAIPRSGRLNRKPSQRVRPRQLH